jgi:hypothetical protein
MSNELTTQNWFRAMIEECDAIITETIHNSRWELIVGYHALGERILEERSSFEREKIYGKKIVQLVAGSLGKSKRTIYNAIGLATKFPDVNSLPQGKNISWSKICREVLPEKYEECHHAEYVEVLVKMCKFCKKKKS